MKDFIKKAIRLSSEKDNFLYNLIIIGSGFVLGIYFLLVFVYNFPIQFKPYKNELDVVGLTNLYGYPKQKEIFYYILSLILISSVGVLTWLSWIFYSSFISKYFKISLEKILCISSIDFLPSFLALYWIIIYKKEINFSLVFLAFIIFFIKLFNFFLLKKGYVSTNEDISK
ncbi:MAG: hypothetical protein A3C43_06765 [Candidatus Schekmanbacteria bacterium RIFCSPHIGHO2_02_FULL_38_11]|uniref:Uncharacterized protein n=1 Tax=Candidatus Schekmanbacteria bacterium RIFCSPLOWO2_12_FULL_38_15 TaxID=1817883 RepID=A0A1F7SP22_9BACT|nr:MAG: hypothetical protein A2043_08355 [Candidatus Schekmanbacteria bacterium GWA2_38_9]OGL48462.1 MAG: hypothetical protein A3H37_07510 [Candidatus Schekmanbacteria bacterium RIFCSPLOWO2_02_FULL_38_14]OGL50190.1 MAG: hypothetical protein A3C43_06765 [Candidatus Schekmanbacteria bacterium RIFCSPHIGHO2_02_FULL_38_11]OGL54937.1 MAG: hypothetical protein A3G31_02330 [Candidatus Schekmanbacteria bacterium RIFCSPLOWO2_12_FULL_38_15]